MTTKRICLWSSPRNLSTALMYSFAQRPDTIVFDEPLYAHYLRATGANHPGRGIVLQSQDNDGNQVVQQLIHNDFGKPVLFCKQMTHHVVDLPLSFLLQVSNILFIREPKQIISSYAQVIRDVKMQDIGLDKQWELYHFLTQKQQNFAIVDSGEILKNPEKVITDLCCAMQLQFYKEMLSWQSGPKPEDGVWAKYWYNSVHKTTHFAPQETSSRPLPGYLQPLYEECKQYYDLLCEHSIKA